MGHDVCDDVGDGDNGNNTTAATTQTKGMAGMPVEREGGLLAEDAAAVAAAAESVTFQFKNMGAKEWKRSHKSNRVLCYIS